MTEAIKKDDEQWFDDLVSTLGPSARSRLLERLQKDQNAPAKPDYKFTITNEMVRKTFWCLIGWHDWSMAKVFQRMRMEDGRIMTLPICECLQCGKARVV